MRDGPQRSYCHWRWQFPCGIGRQKLQGCTLYGHGVPELLDAILQVMPLDAYVEKPVSLMEVMKGDPVKTPIWDTYKDIIANHDPRGAEAVGTIERFAFYKEASTAYAIVTTGESAVYANVMLQKGVVQE